MKILLKYPEGYWIWLSRTVRWFPTSERIFFNKKCPDGFTSGHYKICPKATRELIKQKTALL